MTCNVPVSVGELLDKITILEIKIEHGLDSSKQELEHLLEIEKRLNLPPIIKKMQILLHEVNKICWGVEEGKRSHEAMKDFGDSFIDLSRSVYYFNDIRADIKKKINNLSGSEILEHKSHGNY